jgi:hypothetical protein
VRQLPGIGPEDYAKRTSADAGDAPPVHDHEHSQHDHEHHDHDHPEHDHHEHGHDHPP